MAEKIKRPRRAKTMLEKVDHALRDYALTFPEAYEEFPWNERVIKVNRKIFAFVGILPAPWNVFRLGVKLPQSHGDALMFPFAEPMGYGLGKSGWVTLQFKAGDDAPLDMLKTWIEESYRALAPKKFVARRDTENKK